MRIGEALGEIEGGTFGLCRTCHDPIEAELLHADPLIRFCIDHLDRGARQRLEADLDLAARIQQRLLPSAAAAGSCWRTARAYVPAGPVGGDELCNAGHLPTLLVRPDGVTELGATGLPTGMFCDGEYEAHRLVLAPGESLLLYTDGVPRGDDVTLFALERLWSA